MSVTKYTPFWSERFQFASALKLDSDATCINVLPFKDHEGLSKYVAVSDDKGRVYVFLRNGDVLVEFDTSMESPITAMVSYTSTYKNESFVVTGHENGEILIHRVWEGSGGEDWSSLFMEKLGHEIRESECEGLNHSIARTYVFDATERVRYKKKVEMDEPLALQAIKGYLLIVNPKKVHVFNVSSPHYVRVGVPRPVFSSMTVKSLLLLALEVVILALFAKKKEALTSWGPDDPFSSTSATTSAPLASGSGDRSFADSSSEVLMLWILEVELSEVHQEGMALLQGSLAARRVRIDLVLQITILGQLQLILIFAAASELKYRASTMEPPGFPKRRDGLFVGNQVVNDRS
ncbi:putative membrane protein [Sesbania bispinosa]|nr:putative membrane protein [Sesbania bispinosa]